MSSLVRVRLDEAIAEVERELELRRRVYPQWIRGGRISTIVADRQTERLGAARAFLIEFRRLKGGGYDADDHGSEVAG